MKMDNERRKFLGRAGKVALATPPAMVLLLEAEGRHYALAMSGKGGRSDPVPKGNAFGQMGVGPAPNGNGWGNLSNGNSNSNGKGKGGH